MSPSLAAGATDRQFMAAAAAAAAVAAAYPSPPDNQSLRGYPYHTHPQALSLNTTMQQHYRNPHDHAGPAPMSPPDTRLQLHHMGAGTGTAYGGGLPPMIPPAVMPSPEYHHNGGNYNMFGEHGYPKPPADVKLTREGHPAKRRGPKPDSKPAMTRRQELNRQAQRTHRERKEKYIKDLEGEVQHLRGIYNNVNRDKERLAQENYTLKSLLQQHGLLAPPGMMDDNVSNASGGQQHVGGSSGPNSTSYGPPSATASPSFVPSIAMPLGFPSAGPSPARASPEYQPSASRRPSAAGQTLTGQRNANIDFERAGIDFVL